MVIFGLSKLIADEAPAAIKEYEINYFFSRKVAIDANVSLYQFLTKVGHEGGSSYLLGLFFRIVGMVENGIMPVYVFDGKPPTMKVSCHSRHTSCH